MVCMEKYNYIGMKVTPELQEKIRNFSQSRGMGQSSFIRYAVIKEMERDGK